MAVLAGNKISLASQVATTLQQRVRTGLYAAGNPLPSIRTLCREFSVSQGIVQQAIRKLEEEGVVKAHHGKGILVENKESCDRAAIFFGVVHPYVSSMHFHRDVLAYIDEAFAERSNFAVVRSSKDNPAAEREICQHLITNGVKGLILWSTNDDPNGEFFMELSKQIPVVLIDRLLTGADLPSVVLDYHGCGRDVCQTVLGQMQRKRLLVLMDNLWISSYQELSRGIEQMAREMNRSNDLTILQLPLTQTIQRLDATDWSGGAWLVPYVRRVLSEGGYDAVFSTQGEMIDGIFCQMGLSEEFPNVQTATLASNHPVPRSLKYSQQMHLEWSSDACEMISTAADMVQRWVLSRSRPQEHVALPIKMRESRIWPGLKS